MPNVVKTVEIVAVREEIVRILLAHHKVDPLDLVTWQTEAIQDAVRLLMRTVKKAVE